LVRYFQIVCGRHQGIHSVKTAEVRAAPFPRHHVATATTVDRLCDLDHVPAVFYQSTRP
jgi:hypothetical protein